MERHFHNSTGAIDTQSIGIRCDQSRAIVFTRLGNANPEGTLVDPADYKLTEYFNRIIYKAHG